MLKKIDRLIQKWFFAQGYIKALESLLDRTVASEEYWRSHAGKWRKEFERCYDQLQAEKRVAAIQQNKDVNR